MNKITSAGIKKDEKFEQLLKENYNIVINKPFEIVGSDKSYFEIDSKYELQAYRLSGVLRNDCPYNTTDIFNGYLEVVEYPYFPENNISYYCVSGMSVIEQRQFDNNNIFDVLNFRIGNYFIVEDEITNEVIEFYNEIISNNKPLIKTDFAYIPLPEEEQPEQFLVTFKLKSGQVLGKVLVLYGVGVDQPEFVFEEGYELERWVDEEGNEVDLSSVTSELTVYAELKDVRERLTYSFYDGFGLLYTIEVIKGESITPPVYEVAEGLYFIEWIDGDGSSVSFDNITTNKDVYVSVGINQYNVYLYDESNVLIGVIPKYHGNSISDEVLSEFYTREDNTFIGWYDILRENEIDFTNITSDMNAYVKLEESNTCSVKFYDDDGEFIEEMFTEKGGSVTPPTFIKQGYIFLGWYVPDGSVLQTFDNITNNIEAHAKVEIIMYTPGFYDFNRQIIEEVTVPAFTDLSDYELLPLVKEFVSNNNVIGWYSSVGDVEWDITNIQSNLLCFAKEGTSEENE